MCSQLKIPEEQQIIKIFPFSFVDLLRRWNHQMCCQLKIPEEKQIIKLCPFHFVDLLQALESPNVRSAEDTRGEADY
jgi:hypothetical protein